MTIADVKLKIFRQIDSFEKSRLEEFYCILVNYVNGKKDISDWDKLTDEQKQGLIDAINEIEDGKGISHEKVITKMRKKYSNA